MPARTLEEWIRTARTVLPAGRLFDLDPGTDMRAYLTPILELFRARETRTAAAVAELDPARTTEMLAEWEHEYGLPEACGRGGALTETERRENLLEKINRVGSANLLDIQRLVALHGIAVQIDDQATDSTLPAHTMRVSAPNLSAAQRETLTCLLDLVVPAHVARLDTFRPDAPTPTTPDLQPRWTGPDFRIPKSWSGTPWEWPDAPWYALTFDHPDPLRAPRGQVRTPWPITENLTMTWQLDPDSRAGTVSVAPRWAGTAPTRVHLVAPQPFGAPYPGDVVGASIEYRLGNRTILVYPTVRAWRPGDPVTQRLTIVLSLPGYPGTITGHNQIVRTDS